ncbi:MAG: hypothetical protein PHQ27_09005 [Victivallales bacterium]|nr:hypothetical protein [Victivallales bacterium]
MYHKRDRIRKPLIFFLIASGAAIVIWAVGLNLLASTRRNRDGLQQELMQLPVFDGRTERAAIVAKNKLTPAALNAVYPAPEELNRLVEQQLAGDAEKKFSLSQLQAEIDAIRKKYTLYIGKSIFIRYYDHTGATKEISGRYEGCDNNTVFIRGKAIRITQILPEFREGVRPNSKKQAARIKKAKEDFAAERRQFITRHRRELEKTIYTGAGYLLTSRNEWRVPSQFVVDELAGRRQQAADARSARIDALRKQYRVWGIFPLQLQPLHAGE